MATVTSRPPAPALRRPRTVMVGTLFASGASFMVFLGLLAGTLRRDMIENSSLTVEERVLTLADLETAERIYLGNSVRGLMQARRLA